MNQEEIIEFLADFEVGDVASDNLSSFLKKAGVTYDKPTIHIAGSNGKSATALYLHSILVENEYMSALFLTSFENSIAECIRINDKLITLDELSSIINEHKKLFKKFDLTRKEIIFACFLIYINNKEVNAVIIESGNGGRSDFTNLDYEDSLLSIITSISLNHTNVLGTTTSEIAYQYAGIIEPNSKVLIGKIDENSEIIIRDEADKLKSNTFVVDSYFSVKNIGGSFLFDYRPYKNLMISGFASYLIKDACLAIEAVKLLSSFFEVKEENLKRGLGKLLDKSYLYFSKGCYFDLCDNVEAANNLIESIRYLIKKPTYVLFASDLEMNIAAILPLINNYIENIILTNYGELELRNEEDYFLYLGDYAYQENPFIAMNEIKDKDPEASILVVGNKDFVTALRSEIDER